MPDDNSIFTRARDRVAKSLWSGEVRSEHDATDVIDSRPQNPNDWQAIEPTLSKKTGDDGLRRGTVPEHIENPHKGRPRSFNPLDLRELAKSAAVQINMSAVLGDLRDVPWSVVPESDSATVLQSTIDQAERDLADLNPNPESFDDINAMLARDLLSVGNCVSVVNNHVDGRRAEAVPLDPVTFTADWNEHRILQKFYQYDHTDQRWAEPEEFSREEILWATYQPTVTRAGIYGYSPVEVVQRFINIAGGLVDKEINELEEGMPSGIISLVGDEWSDQNYQNFRSYWQEEVQGEQMKHPVAEGEAKFVPFNMTYKELQVLDRQQWYSKLVGAAFRTPVSETGLAIGEEMTRATDISQRQKYKKRALGALLQQLEDLWTKQYLHQWYSENIKLKFDPGRDLMEKHKIAKTNKIRLANGTTTPNEIREDKGLDPVPWGDKPLALQKGIGGAGGGGSSARNPEGSGGESGGVGEDAELANQNALDEGLQQDSTPTNDGGGTVNFSDGGSAAKILGSDSADGFWLPAGAEAVSKKELRTGVDQEKFSFSPEEIQACQNDIEAVFERYIEEVMDQLRGHQGFLRRPTIDQPGKSPEEVAAQKNLNQLAQLIQNSIGLEFAKDVKDVLVEHKLRQVSEGESAILEELRNAGLATETIDLDDVRDRVAESIRRRTLRITKPISKRLESDLRDVLAKGWNKGWRITKIEDEIEKLSDNWTGYQAERLARDQIGRAAKEGRTEYAEETGDLVGGWARTWIDSDDDRVRDSHELMDGVTVGPGESWIVDYRPDGGPAAVEEDYPGESKWGIQCRCDFTLAPMPAASKALKWADEKTYRMKEIEEQEGLPIEAVLLIAEYGDESRREAHQRLGISRPTYYAWIKDAGLMD